MNKIEPKSTYGFLENTHTSIQNTSISNTSISNTSVSNTVLSTTSKSDSPLKSIYSYFSPSKNITMNNHTVTPLSPNKETEPNEIEKAKNNVQCCAECILYPKIKNYLTSFALAKFILAKELDEAGKLNNTLFTIVNTLHNNPDKDNFDLECFKSILRDNGYEISTCRSILLFVSYRFFEKFFSYLIPLFLNHFLQVVFEKLFDQKKEGSRKDLLTNLLNSLDHLIKDYTTVLQNATYQKLSNETLFKQLDTSLLNENNEPLSKEKLYENFCSNLIEKFVISLKDIGWIKNHLNKIDSISHNNKLFRYLILPYVTSLNIFYFITNRITDFISASIIQSFVYYLAPSLVKTIVQSLNDSNTECTINNSINQVLREQLTFLKEKIPIKEYPPYKEKEDPHLQEIIQNLSYDIANFLHINSKSVTSSNVIQKTMDTKALPLLIKFLIGKFLPEILNDSFSQYFQPNEFSTLLEQLLLSISTSMDAKKEYPLEVKKRAKDELDKNLNELIHYSLINLPTDSVINKLGHPISYINPLSYFSATSNLANKINNFVGSALSYSQTFTSNVTQPLNPLPRFAREKYVQPTLDLLKNPALIESLTLRLMKFVSEIE